MSVCVVAPNLAESLRQQKGEAILAGALKTTVEGLRFGRDRHVEDTMYQELLALASVSGSNSVVQAFHAWGPLKQSFARSALDVMIELFRRGLGHELRSANVAELIIDTIRLHCREDDHDLQCKVQLAVGFIRAQGEK